MEITTGKYVWDRTFSKTQITVRLFMEKVFAEFYLLIHIIPPFKKAHLFYAQNRVTRYLVDLKVPEHKNSPLNFINRAK